MSTFDGHVKEFPDIRIDRFRYEPGSRPAIAYFLSHVHTDHLVGLEANRGIFVYCSSATREILLKLEKYPHRMDFAEGILERRKKTFDGLGKLLRPIPLETPTEIRVGCGRYIRVTLFDANHCTGSVMFLIEGDGKAVLYTGDVRSELWWVNTLLRNPILLPYVATVDEAPIKRLDNIYLDTTFASKQDPYQHFPPKASGLTELLRKVSRYPPNTLFYFDTWTFGYEEVWQCLSTYLGSKVHVDNYRYGVYRSLLNSAEGQSSDAIKLNGAVIGHDQRKGGCLTKQQSRIHSCEKGTGCEIWSKPFVRITPIISRHQGVDMAELGAGGGHGDLNRKHELDLSDPVACTKLMQLCYSELKDQIQLRDGVFEILTAAMDDPARSIPIELADLGAAVPDASSVDLPLVQAVHALAKQVAQSKQLNDSRRSPDGSATENALPKQITFPFSRHSSYTELCLLIEAFKPKDITPCTVNEKDWTAARSMAYLFGHIYAEPVQFNHDQAMLARQLNDDDDDDEERPMETQYDNPSQTPPKETQITRLPSDTPSPIVVRRHGSQASESGHPINRSQKRRRMSEEGDFWPRTKIDHYSPPRRKSCSDNCSINGQAKPKPADPISRPLSRRSSILEGRPASRMGGIRSRQSSTPSLIEVPNFVHSEMLQLINDRSISQPQQRLRPREGIWRYEPQTLDFVHSERQQLIDNRRFSPTTLESEPKQSLHMHRRPRKRRKRPSDKNCRRQVDQSDTYRRLSPQTDSMSSRSQHEEIQKWDEKELRLALQWEAHDAVLGEGQDWSVMSLVSVQNHQTKDEEL